jgi:hypothetical protein
MKIRDEKLKQKASIPKKLEDGWEPIIDMHVNGFECPALCDLGASISIMPRKIYDMLDLPLFDLSNRKPSKKSTFVSCSVLTDLCHYLCLPLYRFLFEFF